MTVIPFPLARSSRHRLEKLGEAWLAEADRRLQMYAGWLFLNGVPGWIGDGWANYVSNYRNFSDDHPPVDPAAADWPMLWEHFIEVWLAAQPEWKRAVENSLAEMGGAA